MSRRANGWYVLGALAQVAGRSADPRSSSGGVTRFVLLVLALAVPMFVLLQAGFADPAVRERLLWLPLALVAVALVGGFVVLRYTRAKTLADYLQALQHPGPETLVDVIERGMRKAKHLPDSAALAAPAKAIAYALYDREQDAIQTLAQIAWRDTPALVQGHALNAEGFVELLCRRDPYRALDLFRRARSLASLSRGVPGAARSEAHHLTCIAVAEVLSNAESQASWETLERSLAAPGSPRAQLLAAFGLAIALERSGNPHRAAELRAWVRWRAPHCRPLHLEGSQFTTCPQPRTGGSGPVSASLGSAPPNPDEQPAARAARLQALQRLKLVLPLVVALLLLFLAIWAQLSLPP